ncbi:MAG: zinc ribbon domain-containing protein [Limisphaerales bacterium]|jgi:predicted  nucleic acid-binding Zn-ribbon protein
MLEIIERLKALQDCDDQILKTKDELARIPVDQRVITERLDFIHAQVESTRKRIKELESGRKECELEVAQKKQLIDKYSIQQYQTKKNDEYRALENEIRITKDEIRKIEDRELELMEQIEKLEKELKELVKQEEIIKKEVTEQLAVLKANEERLLNELASLESQRKKLAEAVDAGMLLRYERILKNKGGRVVVGIDRGVCGGCHMRLSRQLVVDCRAQNQVCFCPNCGRIIYYSPEMDVAVAD